MRKRYSQKFQRYFVKLLQGAPWVFEREAPEGQRRSRSRGVRQHFYGFYGSDALAANTVYYKI